MTIRLSQNDCVMPTPRRINEQKKQSSSLQKLLSPITIDHLQVSRRAFWLLYAPLALALALDRVAAVLL